MKPNSMKPISSRGTIKVLRFSGSFVFEPRLVCYTQKFIDIDTLYATVA